MIIAILDDNECNFGIKFDDVSLKDKIKEYMEEGLAAWYAAAYCAENDEEYENDYFTKEEIESFYWAGYAEPTEKLLEKNNIPFESVDLEYNDDDEVINVDEVIWY